jgi:hypothetical protein
MRYNYAPENLTQIQKQQNFVRKMNSQPMPCPRCAQPQTIYQAAGMLTAQQMDEFDDTAVVRDLKCVTCHTPLQQSVVFAIGEVWHWEVR